MLVENSCVSILGTVSLKYSDSASTSCESDDISLILVLSYYNITTVHVCFNVSMFQCLLTL